MVMILHHRHFGDDDDDGTVINDDSDAGDNSVGICVHSGEDGDDLSDDGDNCIKLIQRDNVNEDSMQIKTRNWDKTKKIELGLW